MKTAAVATLFPLLLSTSAASADDLGVTATASDATTESLEPAADRPAKRARRHGRMALEAVASLAIGTSWYWRDNGKPNEVDWQLPWDARALGAKLGVGSDGWRFDGNAFELNALGHPAFGALTHFLARKNGYSLAEAFLISTAASGVWELLVEWAEYGSINDMLSTSTTGIPVGEAAHQLVGHWRQARYEVAAGAGLEAGDTIGMLGAHAALDRTTTTAGTQVSGAGTRVGVGVEAIHDGALRAFEGGAKTSLGGWSHNTAHMSLFAGASAEFYVRDRKERTARESDLLSFTAVGPTLDVQLRPASDLSIAVGADLYGNFAMLKSQAFAAWRAANPTAIVRNSMQDKARPYYYAWGLTADPRVNVHYRGVSVGGKLAASRFGSIEGHDRDQEMLTSDLHISDRDTFAQAWAGYSTSRFALAVDGRLRRRTGELDHTRASTGDTTTMFTLAVRH